MSGNIGVEREVAVPRHIEMDMPRIALTALVLLGSSLNALADGCPYDPVGKGSTSTDIGNASDFCDRASGSKEKDNTARHRQCMLRFGWKLVKKRPPPTGLYEPPPPWCIGGIPPRFN
jgi:hypothetical protein